MFDSTRLKAAVQAQTPRQERIAIGHGVPAFMLEPESDRRRFRLAVALAVLAHLVLFVVTVPEGSYTPRELAAGQRTFVVRQVRFQPPPPQGQQQIPKRREKRRVIPIPDPTPDQPEPIRTEETAPPSEIDLDAIKGIFGVPDGLAQGQPELGALGAVPLTGDMTAPVKLYAPQPIYTEEARQARIQGVVILQTVVDAEGRVTNVKVLKGLPQGLSDAAVAAVMQWRFEPAKLDGAAIAVYFNFTVSFALQ